MPNPPPYSSRGLFSRQEPGPTSKKGKSILLAIGIDQYQHISNLNNAVRDVDYLAEVLIKRYQFRKKWITKLTNKEATLARIFQSFHDLLESAKKEDEVLIYFSGHGTFNKVIDRGYWIPYDGKPWETHTLFSNGTLVDFVASVPSRHVVLIVDSCFSGSLFGGIRKHALSERLSSIPSRWVLTSGRNEVVSDGTPGANSPFAESLIFHLNNNHTPDFRITELYPRIIEQVGTNTEQLPQCEPIRNVGHKGGEFVFKLQSDSSAAISLPSDYQSAGSRPPSSTKADGIMIKIGIIAIAMLLTIFALWRVWSVMGNTQDITSKNLSYDQLIPMPNGGFIIDRDGKFGYADQDTLMKIALQFDEAHPFIGHMARVKKNGKYGWIDTSGQTVIPMRYERASDFQNGRAMVRLNGQDLTIDEAGYPIQTQEPQASPTEEDSPASVPPQLKASPAPQLYLSTKAIELGIIPADKDAQFSFTLTNQGNADAGSLHVTTSEGIELMSERRFELKSDQRKVLHFQLESESLVPGNYDGHVNVKWLNRSEYVSVHAQVTAPPAAESSTTIAVRRIYCNLGKPNCSIQFYDKFQQRQIAFTTNKDGGTSYSIAEDLIGKTVEVSYCDNKSKLTIRVQPDGCIALPQ